MRYSFILLTGILGGLLSTVIGSYDGGYAPAHDLDDFYEPSYPDPPIVHPPSHGHSAGSYYHYHVPLVGQQHHQPSYHHQDHSHYLWPLLLLLALPLLFLPLLPLLLLPLGISLLALLAPGGMMMMMMMMMMMPGMMMRTDNTLSGRALNEMRTFGEVLLLDVTSLMSKYARSLDFDQCPLRISCEMGSIIFPSNSTDTGTARAFSSFIMEQYIPKGKVRKLLKQYEKAFWTGSNSITSCNAFNCNPTFKVYKSSQNKNFYASESNVNGSSTSAKPDGQQKLSSSKWAGYKNVNYIYSQAKGSDNSQSQNKISPSTADKSGTTESPVKLKKVKRSHYSQRYAPV